MNIGTIYARTFLARVWLGDTRLAAQECAVATADLWARRHSKPRTQGGLVHTIWGTDAASASHVSCQDCGRPIVGPDAHECERKAQPARGSIAAPYAVATRGINLLDRAADTERDAAHDIELAALYREAASRGLKEADVFDQWSPR